MTTLRNPRARRATLGCLAALVVLHWAWQMSLTGGFDRAHVVSAVVLSLPAALAFIALLVGRPSARFWAGVIALFYFCHGVTEAWALASARWPGLAEVAIAVVLVLSSSWDGLSARFARKPAPAPPNV